MKKKTAKAKSAKSRAIAKATEEVPDPFRHVVVLMLENRSFDHVLGGLQAEIPALDGIPPGGPVRSNPAPQGPPVEQRPGASRVVDPDPPHETQHVLKQIANGMSGFVSEYAGVNHQSGPAQWQQVMAYHARGGAPETMPAIHALARSFAICDGWYASVPGPTWTNRLFAMSGTSLGRVEMPRGVFHPNLHRYPQPSVFRRLEEAGRSCRIYFGDFPLALLLEDRRSVTGARSFAPFSQFDNDAKGDPSDFPDFVWIEPDYLGSDANDDHPPHDVLAGQRLVAQVYESLRKRPNLFESTLLVITYDEHGGFYDHVSPMAAVPPDAHREEYRFDLTGVRVPMVFVSPWLHPQVVHTGMDHTALLRSVQLKWGLGPMGARVAAAPDAFALLHTAEAPRKVVPRLSVPKPKALEPTSRRALMATVAERLNANEEAIVSFSTWLEAQTPAPSATKAKSLRKLAAGPTDARELAAQRALRFLRWRRRGRAK